ncbi:MAG: 4Fe-4S binding protein, partial [Chloroflexi bacterium]|nr:4Fe-4S binding protein [Chloroflexota bacterium]
DPEIVPTSKPGEKVGLGTYHYDRIEVVGDDISTIIVSDFDVIRKPPVTVSSGRLMTIIKNQTCPGPAIDKTRCTRCGICQKVCPLDPKAIIWDKETGEFPIHNYNRCIRCYCCQEMCPEGAISIKNTFLGRAVFGRV